MPVHMVPVRFSESGEIESDPDGGRDERQRITVIPQNTVEFQEFLSSFIK